MVIYLSALSVHFICFLSILRCLFRFKFTVSPCGDDEYVGETQLGEPQRSRACWWCALARSALFFRRAVHPAVTVALALRIKSGDEDMQLGGARGVPAEWRTR